MSLTYAQYNATIANLMVTDPTNAEYVQILPSIIDYAEQRMYRELDLLSTVTRDSSASLSPNSRDFTLPQTLGRFVVVNDINLITPAGSTTTTGTRQPLTPTSRGYIDFVWPTAVPVTNAPNPTYFAMVTDQTLIVGGPPNAAFNIEVVGTIRPTPLSSTNTTTYLTLYLPDVFVACSMIFASGFMRNFGAQMDDPRMAASWEDQYTKLFASANVEQQRSRFAAGGWTSLSPNPIATPPRQ